MKYISYILLLCLSFIGQQCVSNNNDGILLQQESRATGRGNQHDVILKIMVNHPENDNVALRSASLNLDGTTSIDDITEIRFYFTRNLDSFDERDVENAIFLGSVEPQTGDFTCALADSLYGSGVNYLWLCCAVADDAVEGNFIDASLISLTTDNETITVNNTSPSGKREILLARKLLYAPNDYNSLNYRIPAIITAHDGSLVIATDKRKYNQADLPQDIDILINRSLDGGKTWSEPLTLAQGTGVGHGFGDAALARTNEEGGLICVFVGGDGLWESVVTPGKMIRSYMCKSLDNGLTWTEPVEITDFIYGSGCPDPVRATWKASFFGSGSGLLCSNGRIMFVAAIRETEAQSLSNYVVFSDDNGATWNVGGRASTNGDEAKVTELEDDRILMSIRHSGIRWYNISEDNGITWNSNVSSWNEMPTTACNGDLIRYTSVNSGYNKNRLLHSLPDNPSQRTNVTVFLSYDEGESWEAKKTIIPYGSAYSSLNILPDGTIGLYVEENYNTDNYSIYFVNFSLEWLTDGNDTYTPPVGINENNDGKTELFQIYPNPTNNSLNIKGKDIKSIVLFNNQGQEAGKWNYSDVENATLDLSRHGSGNYIIEITDNKGVTFSKKIVLNK